MRENPEARAAGSVAARSFTIVSGAVADSDEALAEMRSQNSSTVTVAFLASGNLRHGRVARPVFA